MSDDIALMAHLLRRAGFGAPRDELEAYVAKGYVSRAVADFYQDLREHGRGEEVLVFIYTEFGRRVRDNGGGTDHGTGGICWVIGDQVKGGLYGEYPSLKAGDLEDDGDLQHNTDFRSVYATILESWLQMDPRAIVGGAFEELDVLAV